MGKGKKSFLIVLMVTLALGALLAACSGGGNGGSGGSVPEGNEGNSGSASTPSPTASPPVKEEPKEKPVVSLTFYDRGRVPAEEGTIEKNRWVEWLSENGPATLQVVAVPRWESEAKLNTLFASGNAPDLILEYAPAIKQPLYDSKLLLPLDELIEQHSTEYKALIERFPALKNAGIMSDGKVYQFGRLLEPRPHGSLLIRQDWLEKLKLGVPRTTEELYEVAKAFAKQDPDGNGANDTYGLALSGSSGTNIDLIFRNNGFNLIEDKMVYSWDYSVDAAKFKKRLYDEGIVDRDYLTDANGNKAKQDFLNGKLGIYPSNMGGNYHNFAVNELTALRKNAPDAKVIPIPYPASPAGAFNPSVLNPIQMTAVVNRNAKNPEAVMKVVDFLVARDTNRVLGHGLEGVHYEQDANGCPVSITTDANKNQVGYTTDYSMLSNSEVMTDGICGYNTMFKTDDPIQAEGLEMYKQALKAYVLNGREMSHYTVVEHKPQLPKELALVSDEMLKEIEDTWVKAIVGGTGYTVEQALNDAQKLWNNGSGQKLQQFMDEWYAANKETALLWDDVYEIAKPILEQQMQ